MAPPPPPAGTPQDGGAASHIPCNPLLSAAFRHLPFSSPRPSSRPPHIGRMAPGDPAAAAAASLAAAADRLVHALGAAASDHPFLKPLLSLPSDIRNFFQIRRRGSRIPGSLSAHNFAAILPGDSVAGLVVANGITNFLNIYNTLLVVRLVLTWFPNSPPVIVSPLSTLCDPYLNIFRGIIPPLGGTLDLSPILAFLVLNFFTSTAAALPAELPVTTAPQQGILSSHPMMNLTTSQKKWMRRVCCKKSKNSEDVE